MNTEAQNAEGHNDAPGRLNHCRAAGDMIGAAHRLNTYGMLHKPTNPRVAADMRVIANDMMVRLVPILNAAAAIVRHPVRDEGGRTILEVEVEALQEALAAWDGEALSPANESAILLHERDLPDPATVVECDDGSIVAIMFLYGGSEVTFRSICQGNGYDVKGMALEEDDPLWSAYERGIDSASDWKAFWSAWRPVAPEPGWTLAYTGEGDDGPLAIFVRPQSEAVTGDADGDGIETDAPAESRPETEAA